MNWICPRCHEVCNKYKIDGDLFERELEVLCTKCGLRWYPENIPTDTNERSCHKICPNCHGDNTKRSRKKENGHMVSECVCRICGFRWDPDEFDFDESSDITGTEFEKLVAEKLRLEGYSDIRLTDVTNDHGCDILAINPKGVSAVIQCKRYSGSVGVHAVQEADSARNFYKRTLAIVITNSTFTSAARLHASRTNVILIENYK